VADNSHQISGVAERYASSLYELAADAKSVDAVAKDLDRFQAMIDSNSDLQRRCIAAGRPDRQDWLAPG
jgi:F-type H+-transporting ATPase subunit delta